MPATYNGIGTKYHGKKNVETRTGVCQHCGQTVTLSSYDTRLWFVIFFIPVIPLGRKRIIEYCPACTRHFAMEKDKWETAKQLEISGALEKYRSNPTPEAAMEAHQQLINFHQFAQATEFRKTISEKFHDNAKVQAYLGMVLAHLGQNEEAAPHFARALELRPDMPEARIGVAQGHVAAGRLDEARPLLDFLEKPGAAQLYSLEPLETLGRAYQQANRHTEALEVFKRLQEALPNISDYTAFRKLVEKSEKALGRKESILPKRKFSWRRFLGMDRTGSARGGTRITGRGLAIAGIIAGLFVFGMMAANEYIRRHRSLYIVNQLGRPVTVQVDNRAPIPLSKGVTFTIVPEGRHHAKISGAAQQEVDFEMRGSYFERWFDHPAWVLNPGGAAVLLLEHAVYAQNPRPVQYSFHYGEPFFNFREVTHPFTPLPHSVQVKEHESKTLTGLEIFNQQMEQVFYDLQKRQPSSQEPLRFAEWRLKLHPEDDKILELYVGAGKKQQQLARVEKFLAAGITNRPIQMEWHRAYQGLRKDRQRDAELAKLYDQMLETEPNNSALLYLRGRLTSDHAEGRRWFEKAREADAKNPYPCYALGYDKAALGDWAAAKPLLKQAVELSPKTQGFRYFYDLSRLALGETAELAEEYSQQLKSNPLDYLAALQLAEINIAAGNTNEARQVVSRFERAATTRFAGSAREVSTLIELQILYDLGDFAGLEKSTVTDRSKTGRSMLFYALIEQGRVDEAVKLLAQTGAEVEEPSTLLTVAIAYRAAGNNTEAETWSARAIAALEKGDDDAVRAASLLKRDTDPTQAEVNELIMPMRDKAIVLTALAQKHPQARALLAGAARKLNVQRGCPYHLIQRVTGAML